MIADESVSPIETFTYCQNGTLAVTLDEKKFPKYNPYDIRVKCEFLPTCYNFNKEFEYLNSTTVQARLNISEKRDFQACSP
jgi:hypothetical protein